jgi:PKD repeat protein
VVPASTQGAQAPHSQVPEFLGYVPNELIVVLTPDASSGLVVGQDSAGRPLVNRPFLQAALDRQGANRFIRQFPTAQRPSLVSTLPDLTGHYKVRIGAGSTLDAAVREFEGVQEVDHVERIGIHSLYQTPDDPYFQGSPNPSFPYDQWHLWDTNGIDADLAWDTETGAPNVLVGILDSGTRYFHIDLGGNSAPWGPDAPFTGGNVFVNPGEIPNNNIDDDGNGFVDDTIGWDFVDGAGGGGVSCIDQDCGGVDNDPDDGDGHGTHTGGTVGAITNNGVLVAGVAGGFGSGDGCKIVPMRIGYHARFRGQVTGVVRMDWAAQAMSYLADLVDAGHNVASINCSWGSSNSGGLNAAVDNLQARDVLIVKSAGNSNSSSADFLGNKAGVLNVAATDINGVGASFTNHGSWVDVAAPGVDVLSLYRNPDDPDPGANYIALLSGTSMSAPHVAGMAAILESADPSLTATDKFNLIVANTDPYSDSRDLGSGIANLREALDAIGPQCDVTADFGASTTAGCAPLGVSFTDLSTGAGINSWSWDFGDGNGSTAQNPSHTYTAAGSYTVSLTASSSACGDTLTRTGYITVSDLPLADFSGSPTSGNGSVTVDFSDLSTGVPTGWIWDFGDGNGATSQNPSHTYTAVGTYTVTLTASNTCGSDGETKVDYITVNEVVGPTEMSVASIVVTKQNLGGGNKQGVATVTILDNNGDPVSGATVIGDFSGKTTDLGVTGVTNGSGVATLLSSSARGGGSWCFEVTNVTGSLTYNASANTETQDCE